MYSSGDSLLYILSSWGSTSWPTFKRVFNEIVSYDKKIKYSAERAISFYRNRAINLFQALGHCDINYELNPYKILITPPVLARLPIRGLRSAVLCGMRFENTIPLIKEKCKEMRGIIIPYISEQVKNQVPVPMRIIIETESADILSSFATSIGAVYENNPPSWIIANNSASLDDYRSTLNWEDGIELTWRRRDFSHTTIEFLDPSDERSSFSLSMYQDPVRLIPIYYCWDGKKRALIDRDWGRYLIFSHYKKNILHYNINNMYLYVPINSPLPKMLLRAAILCSGSVPQTVLGKSVNFNLAPDILMDGFSNIPFNIAQIIAQKTGQTLQIHNDNLGGG